MISYARHCFPCSQEFLAKGHLDVFLCGIFGNSGWTPISKPFAGFDQCIISPSNLAILPCNQLPFKLVVISILPLFELRSLTSVDSVWREVCGICRAS